MHSTFKFKIKINKSDRVLGALHVSLYRFTGTFYATLKSNISIYISFLNGRRDNPHKV